MRQIVITACGCLALAALSRVATSQGPAGSDTLSAAAVADSQTVIKTLEAQLKKNGRDPAAWYRMGMVAWALSERARAPNPPSGLDLTIYGRIADTALKVAIEQAPDNALYRLAYGRMLLMSNVILLRVQAYGVFDKALEIARKDTANHAVLADAAIESGRVHWRRYDALANRRILTSPVDIGRSLNMAMNPARGSSGLSSGETEGGAAEGTNPLGNLKSADELIRNNTQALPFEVSGEEPYRKADELFREAYAADPVAPRSFRSVAMLLAERGRWNELASFARAHVTRIPWDANGWMALGLAMHRSGNTIGASSAYDSAMSFMKASERARLDRMERVLRPSDTTRIQRGGEAERNAFKRFYWTLADPLWSRDGNEPRVEFFARVTYAELRWTVEEMRVRGVDSDRGDIHVRYGPPDIVVALGPNIQEDASEIVTFWIYRSGLVFSFTGMPTYAIARTPAEDDAMVGVITNAQPVRWDNIAAVTVDSMPVQVARFRGGRDSVDLLVAAAPNVKMIKDSSQTNEPVLNKFWLVNGAIAVVYHDTTRLTENGVRTWTRRLMPGGYVYRIEVSAASSTRAGRATSAVITENDPRTGFMHQGFGLSDPLLATSITQPAAGNARWSSIGATPLVGSLPKGGELTVVWENYEFGTDGGASRYTVNLTIVRDRSGAGRITARVLGTLANAARIDTQDDKYSVSFDRRMPHTAAFADQISIGLADTPAGSYTLTLEVTDLVSGKKATRTAQVRIRN